MRQPHGNRRQHRSRPLHRDLPAPIAQFLQLPVQPRHPQKRDQNPQRQDDEAEQDDRRRDRQLKGRMHIAQGDKAHEKEREIPKYLPPQIGKPKRQPLGKVGKGYQHGQQKERALHHPRLRPLHIPIGRRSQCPSAARPIEKILVPMLGACYCCFCQQPSRPLVKGRQPPIAHAVSLQPVNPLAIEHVHIGSHSIHRLHNASLPINRIAHPARRVLRAIEQQQASPQSIAPRRHHGLEPLARLSKDHADRLRPRTHSIHIAK